MISTYKHLSIYQMISQITKVSLQCMFNPLDSPGRPGIPELLCCHLSRPRRPNNLDLNRAIRTPGVPDHINVTPPINAQATRPEAQYRGDDFIQIKSRSAF